MAKRTEAEQASELIVSELTSEKGENMENETNETATVAEQIAAVVWEKIDAVMDQGDEVGQPALDQIADDLARLDGENKADIESAGKVKVNSVSRMTELGKTLYGTSLYVVAKRTIDTLNVLLPRLRDVDILCNPDGDPIQKDAASARTSAAGLLWSAAKAVKTRKVSMNLTQKEVDKAHAALVGSITVLVDVAGMERDDAIEAATAQIAKTFSEQAVNAAITRYNESE